MYWCVGFHITNLLFLFLDYIANFVFLCCWKCMQHVTQMVGLYWDPEWKMIFLSKNWSPPSKHAPHQWQGYQSYHWHAQEVCPGTEEWGISAFGACSGIVCINIFICFVQWCSQKWACPCKCLGNLALHPGNVHIYYSASLNRSQAPFEKSQVFGQGLGTRLLLS